MAVKFSKCECGIYFKYAPQNVQIKCAICRMNEDSEYAEQMRRLNFNEDDYRALSEENKKMMEEQEKEPSGEDEAEKPAKHPWRHHNPTVKKTVPGGMVDGDAMKKSILAALTGKQLTIAKLTKELKVYSTAFYGGAWGKAMKELLESGEVNKVEKGKRTIYLLASEAASFSEHEEKPTIKAKVSNVRPHVPLNDPPRSNSYVEEIIFESSDFKITLKLSKK